MLFWGALGALMVSILKSRVNRRLFSYVVSLEQGDTSFADLDP
jgi:hypothetical protein